MRKERKQMALMMLGDLSVGKTALLKAYLNRQQVMGYHATIGVDFLQTKYKTITNDEVSVRFWDTPSLTRGANISNIFTQGT